MCRCKVHILAKFSVFVSKIRWQLTVEDLKRITILCWSEPEVQNTVTERFLPARDVSDWQKRTARFVLNRFYFFFFQFFFFFFGKEPFVQWFTSFRVATPAAKQRWWQPHVSASQRVLFLISMSACHSCTNTDLDQNKREIKFRRSLVWTWESCGNTERLYIYIHTYIYIRLISFSFFSVRSPLTGVVCPLHVKVQNVLHLVIKRSALLSVAAGSSSFPL